MTSTVGVIDVARRAHVSLGTVSNVLNRPERVSKATRERVLAAIEELGFVRNEAARQLRAGRGRSIGLVVLDTSNPFFTDLAAGVESTAADAGLSVMLCNSGNNPEREEHYLSLLEEQRAFGILITPVAGKSSQIDNIRQRGTSVVFADRGSGRRQCSVGVDDVVGGGLAVNHLLAGGHELIAFVGGPTSISQVRDRLAGARTAMTKAQKPGTLLTVIATVELTFAAGRRAGQQIAALPPRTRPTAAFCANDLVALGLLQELHRLKVAVPQEISVVGYDDIDFAAASIVPLTSVRQPRSEIGRAAATLLIDEVQNPDSHIHRQLVFKPELTVRESTSSLTKPTRSKKSTAASRSRSPKGGG